MMRSFAFLGLVAMALGAGCAHECQCVCTEGSRTAVAIDAWGARAHQASSSGAARRARGRAAIASPSASALLSSGTRHSTPPRTWIYPNPFAGPPAKADPFDTASEKPDPFEADRKADPFEAEASLSAEPSGLERVREEAKASSRAEELRRHLQEITRP